MKKSVFGILTGLFVLTAIHLQAQNTGGPIGLGVIFGEPTGLSFKMWTGDNSAFDAAAAWSFAGDGHLHLHVDYLRHSFNVINVNEGQLPIYFGLGAKVVMRKEPVVGARIPIGLAYMFEDAPLDIFLEIVPGLDLIPSTDFAINGGIGIRYFF